MNTCFLCQCNKTNHASGVCAYCRDDDADMDIVQQYTSFALKLETTVMLRPPVEPEVRKITRTPVVAKEMWQILVTATKYFREFQRKDIVESGMLAAHRANYAFYIFRPLLDCDKRGHTSFWKVKKQFVGKSFDQIESKIRSASKKYYYQKSN